jgi:hypothetical protein
VRVFARSNDPELEEFVGQKVPIHHGSIGDIQSLKEVMHSLLPLSSSFPFCFLRFSSSPSYSPSPLSSSAC